MTAAAAPASASAAATAPAVATAVAATGRLSPAGASVKIQVCLEEGKKSIFIDVDPDSTVLHLKNKVFDKTALRVDSFTLTLGRSAVSDNDTLISLALKFGTKDFVFKIHQQGPKGGMVC